MRGSRTSPSSPAATTVGPTHSASSIQTRSRPSYGRLVGQVDFPQGGNELHHFGWNACSSHLCPWAPNAHVERRYLVVPGTNSSRIHIVDTKPDPRNPTLVKVIEGEEVMAKTGYAAPHTVHCGPDGIYVNALGAPDGNGPGGIFMIDHDTFDVKGKWEHDRGPQHLAYDFAWHLGHDTIVTSEWGTPNMVKDGVNPELLLAGKYGHSLHVWDMKKRRHITEIDLGSDQQMALELRPAHNPTRAYGFVGVVMSLKDLSSSIFLWYLDRGTGRRDGVGEWKAKKVITIPAEAGRSSRPAAVAPRLQGRAAARHGHQPVSRRSLPICVVLGHRELLQYDVSDPFNPTLVGSVRIGGIVRRTAHPRAPGKPLNGGPQMVEVSRDGRRVYLTNSLYSPWDAQFYPDGIRGWLAKFDVGRAGGLTLDQNFLIEFEDGMRPHQVRLQGGDASSDSFCFS